MDQPISCQDIYHIYKHPLSILIHLKFQDKDSVSLNGYREFLFSSCLISSEDDLMEMMKGTFLQDKRGCPIYVHIDKPLDFDFPEEVLARKLCSFRFLQNAPCHN